MEKINVRPLFKIVDLALKPLGWLSWAKSQRLDLMLACSTADLKRILWIHSRQPNGLTEEQKVNIFVKVGGDLSWFEKFNADPNFRKETSNSARVRSGSNDDPHTIEEKLKSLYYDLRSQGLFPQSFEGQKLAVSALVVHSADKLEPAVYTATPFECLLKENIWNNQTLQWLAEDAVESAHSYNRLKNNPSQFIQTLAGYSRFQHHQIEPFLEKNLDNINWMQTERQRGASDISSLRPLWELALKELSEPFVKQLITKNPQISKKLNFTTVLSKRKIISIELFETVMLQEGMSVKRLLRKSRDPEGIVQALRNNQVQSYTKKFVSDDGYTKSVLGYLIHKETQQTRNNIVAALNTEKLQSTDSAPSSPSIRRKM